MSTRYIKGEHFRVRASGAANYRLEADDSSRDENRKHVEEVLRVEREKAGAKGASQ